MSEPQPPVRRALVADDERRIVRLIQTEMERQGHIVVIARDGREALECLKQDDFDLVFLDLTMPYVDGYELLTWIRNHPTKRSTWVVLMTANATEWGVSTCEKHRADMYLAKPIEASNLSRNALGIEDRRI